VQAVTFHAAARRQLQYFWPRLVGDTGWELLDSKFGVVAQAANRAKMSTSTEDVRDLAGEIEWAKSSLISPETYPAAVAEVGRDIPFDAARIAAVYAGYEELKARRDGTTLLDFDDLLLHTAAAIENDAAVAQEFRDRYRCFVVDEYQDVTPLQQRVLDAWLGERDDLTVVGDANQTIYSFTGASARSLLDFPRRFPEATVVRLERDYRSTPQVVSLANQVIGAARGRPAGSRLRLVGQRAAGGEPTFSEYDDEPAEAEAVAKRIRVLLGAGVAASEIAVLFRVNAQSEVYEQALSALNIPYQVRGGERFFARVEVRQALVALRTANVAAPTGELADIVRAVLRGVGLTEEVPAGGAARERWESLLALVAVAEDLAATLPDADLARYLAELDVRAEAQHPPTVQGVTLASMHAAKGLEWDAVFVVGLVEGTLPIQHADGDDAAVEEERRLLYVAVTRAREHLWLSWALSRSPGGRRHRRRSRFLYGVIPEEHPAALAGNARQQSVPGVKPKCRTCGTPLLDTVAVKLGRCSNCPSDVDEDLLARLRAWRGERARQLKVPAYVVFTDATLTAIAEQRPADPAGLVAIPGIGAAKLDRYGQDVLGLVQATR
jgi:DNA helicase-2/ATP-dependent DNA helicase PcrA